MLLNRGELVTVYQEKVMRAGFRAMGSKRWLVATVAMGRIATKSLMRQSIGTKGATARMMMAVMKNREKAIEYLNYKL